MFRDGLRNRKKEAPKFPQLWESPFKRDESEEPDDVGEEKDESISVRRRFFNHRNLAYHDIGIRFRWLSDISYAEDVV